MFHPLVYPQVLVPLGGTPPEDLRKLCMDTVPVVKAAARDHWVALGGDAGDGTGVKIQCIIPSRNM